MSAVDKLGNKQYFTLYDKYVSKEISMEILNYLGREMTPFVWALVAITSFFGAIAFYDYLAERQEKRQ